MPKPLLDLIARSYSKAASEQVRDYVPDDAAWDTFEQICHEVLRETHIEAGACILMSALLSQRLTKSLGATFPVIAGALKVGGVYMYGGDRAFDGALVFSNSAEGWDGHCWVLFGALIADISLGRTARTGRCRAPLAQAVISAFGNQVGLIAVTDLEARRAGLHYLPRYALTPGQVDPLAAGALMRLGRAS